MTIAAVAVARDLRMRSAPVFGFEAVAAGESPVDAAAGVLRGVSAIQAVEALGHGMTCDEVTLEQVRDAINATPAGMKVRFTHPGMCEDGTGKLLGKGTNARIAGGKVLFDLKLAAAAKTSPQGNLWQHVVDLATESPQDVGFSIAAEGRPFWKMADGTEQPVRYDDEGAQVPAPAGALPGLPRFRLRKLRSIDLVDEPAANRDGLFADTSSSLGEEAFHEIDRFLQQNGLTAERAHSFAQRYFAARGVTAATTSAGIPPATSPANPAGPDTMKITAQVLLALIASAPEHLATISSMATGDTAKGVQPASEDEIRAAITEAKLKAHSDQVAALEAKLAALTTEHATALAVKDTAVKDLETKLAAMTAKHDALAKLSTGAPADPGTAPEQTDPTPDAKADEKALKARWDRSPKLRAAFGDQFELFQAYIADPSTTKPELPKE
jgi:hypothetical protein